MLRLVVMLSMIGADLFSEVSGSSLPDAGRDIESFNQTQGEAPTMDAFAQQMRGQSRINWNDSYRVQNIVNYIKDGYF